MTPPPKYCWYKAWILGYFFNCNNHPLASGLGQTLHILRKAAYLQPYCRVHVSHLFGSVLRKSGFGGLGASVLAFGTQVRGCKPGRSRRIFKGDKNPQHAFLRRGSKAVCPMSQICGM